MRDAERMPEDNVGVLDALVAVISDPFWQSFAGLAGCLRDVTACWVELVVLVCSCQLSETGYEARRVLHLVT